MHVITVHAGTAPDSGLSRPASARGDYNDQFPVKR
jgi:hypothetical protein